MSMPVPVVTLTLHDFGIATGSMMDVGLVACEANL
jgi:hypothetical protein